MTKGMLLTLTLLAATIAICLGVTGCDREAAGGDGKVRLVLAVSVGARERESYQTAVRDFEARHPDIDVEIMEIPGNFYQKVLVMIAGRNAPDLMWMGQGFQEFAARGVFLDVTDRVARDIDVAEFAPEAIDWYRFDNRQYGVAFGLDMRFIAYNKALFDAAGVSYPKNHWTYDQFLDAARKLTRDTDGDGRIDQYGFEGVLDVSAFNARVVDDEGTRALCDSPEMIDYLQTNLDLAEKHRVMPRGRQMVNEAFEDLVSTFRQGRVAMMTMATWNLADLQQRCADMRWDIVTDPVVRKAGHWASSQSIVISADTRHPDEAWLLCQAFLARDFQKSIVPRVLPSNLQVQRELVAEQTDAPPTYATLVEVSRSLHRMARVANLNELMRFWFDACDSVWTLRDTPQSAMQRAAREINHTLQMRREQAP